MSKTSELVQRYELHWCRAVGASGQVMTQRCLELASLQERADGQSLQSCVADHADGGVLPSNARQRASEQFPRRYDLAIGQPRLPVLAALKKKPPWAQLRVTLCGCAVGWFWSDVQGLWPRMVSLRWV